MAEPTAQPSKSLQVAVWSVLCAVILGVAVLYVKNDLLARSKLPILGEVQPFTLTNQLGVAMAAGDFKGKVWIADIIFTRCGGPCPRMTEKMAELQKATANPDLRFATLTTDPEYDSPPVLKAYGEKFGADHNRWSFLTGSKPEIKQVAMKSLLLATMEVDKEKQENPNDLFIHSTTFVLVDKRGRLRGVYESLEPGFNEKILADARGLLKERVR